MLLLLSALFAFVLLACPCSSSAVVDGASQGKRGRQVDRVFDHAFQMCEGAAVAYECVLGDQVRRRRLANPSRARARCKENRLSLLPLHTSVDGSATSADQIQQPEKRDDTSIEGRAQGQKKMRGGTYKKKSP